jgi:serine protease
MIAAATDNNEGIAGTGYNLRVQPVRALGKCGGFNSDVLAAMYWAAGLSPPPSLLSGNSNLPPLNPTPAQIINMSLGSDDPCDAMYQQAVTDVTAHGVLIVASAGNVGEEVGDPANCTGALAVVGVRHVGTKVGFSSLGVHAGIAAPAGNCVNTAPGSDCLFSLDTTTNAGTTVPGPNTYTNMQNSSVGTSFASPQAAAVAGLMKAVNPALTPAALIARIKSSARAFPTTSDNPNIPACHVPASSTDVQQFECICNTQSCGAGLLFAAGAVNEALRPIALATLTGTVGPGAALTLDGSRSGVATGRTASYLWSVVSTSNGATAPTIQNPTQAVAAITAPSQGTVVLRLTVTDNLNATDTADLTVTVISTGGSATSTSPPPSTSTGGGGALSWPLLLGMAAMLATYRTRRFARL